MNHTTEDRSKGTVSEIKMMVIIEQVAVIEQMMIIEQMAVIEMMAVIEIMAATRAATTMIRPVRPDRYYPQRSHWFSIVAMRPARIVSIIGHSLRDPHHPVLV